MAASVINTHGKQIAVKAGGELTDATRDLVFSRHKPFCSSTYFIYNAAERQTEPFRRNWGGGGEREIDLKQEKNEKEGELKKRQSLACFQTGTWWDFILPSIQGVLPVGLRQPYPASLIRIRTWPYVIRWVMYSHKSMFLIAFGCIAREVTEHRVYVCSLSFDILCGRCTTAS